jgi:hypothetical protein
MGKVTDFINTPDKFGAVISYLVATEPRFSACLGDAIVPALDSELLQDVTERVRRIGGAASLVALRVDLNDKTRIVIGKMTVRESADDTDHHVPFDRRCKLGDLLTVLAEGSSITLRLSEDELELEDVDAPEVKLSDGKLALA